MKQNIFLSSLKESFSSVMKNKLLFASAVFLQAIFLFSFFFASIHFQSKMLESMQSINFYVAQQENSEIDITKNILEQKEIFGPDPGLVARELASIRKIFITYVFASFLIFVFFISLIYSISRRISLHSKFFFDFMKSLAISSFCFAAIFGLFYFITDQSLFSLETDASSLAANYLFFVIVSSLVCYFMIISLSLCSKNSISDSAKKSIYAGIRKIHYILPSVLLSLVLFLALGGIGIYIIESSPIFGFVLFALALKTAAFGRILVIEIIEKIE